MQGDPDADPDAWWNNLERSRREGELYARRVLPGAAGRSAAASVAVAITLAHPGKSVLAGQAATLDAACDALGGCDQGDWWTSVHDRDDADVNEDTPDPQHLSIDDAGWALTILSRAIEPAVHAVIEGMLICLAPTLCTSHCDVCNEWVGLGNTTAEEVVRRVELALHVAPKQASRSVLDCVASFECLRDIATEVALAFGAEGALPPTARLVTVTKANIELLEGARAEAKQNDLVAGAAAGALWVAARAHRPGARARADAAGRGRRGRAIGTAAGRAATTVAAAAHGDAAGHEGAHERDVPPAGDQECHGRARLARAGHALLDALGRRGK